MDRPEAIETKCAGCGAVIIWPDDGSLPVCSFPCDRALFEEGSGGEGMAAEYYLRR